MFNHRAVIWEHRREEMDEINVLAESESDIHTSAEVVFFSVRLEHRMLQYTTERMSFIGSEMIGSSNRM